MDDVPKWRKKRPSPCSATLHLLCRLCRVRFYLMHILLKDTKNEGMCSFPIVTFFSLGYAGLVVAFFLFSGVAAVSLFAAKQT